MTWSEFLYYVKIFLPWDREKFFVAIAKIIPVTLKYDSHYFIAPGSYSSHWRQKLTLFSPPDYTWPRVCQLLHLKIWKLSYKYLKYILFWTFKLLFMVHSKILNWKKLFSGKMFSSPSLTAFPFGCLTLILLLFILCACFLSFTVYTRYRPS